MRLNQIFNGLVRVIQHMSHSTGAKFDQIVPCQRLALGAIELREVNIAAHEDDSTLLVLLDQFDQPFLIRFTNFLHVRHEPLGNNLNSRHYEGQIAVFILRKDVFEPFPLVRTKSVLGIILTVVISHIEQNNVDFDSLFLHDIVLVDPAMFFQSPLSIQGLTNKVEEDVPHHLPTRERVIAIVNSVVVIIPHPNDLTPALKRLVV
jgi:hypothetical protein